MDELPQVINILKGEMSFVGPRPVVEKEVEEYGENKERFLSVKPGLTGYWQVNGRSNTTFEERMEMELYYVDNCSLWLDIKIFFKTFITVFKKREQFKMTIDIICPVYNAEKYIENQYNQIKSQGFYNNVKNINYIITESKDGTLSVVERLQKKDEKKKIQCNKETGIFT